MITIYLICVILPLVAVSVFYGFVTDRKIEKENAADLEFAVSEAGTRVENITESVIFTSNVILADDELLSLINGKANASLLKTANALEEKMKYFLINDNIDKIEIYTHNDKLYRSGYVKQITALESALEPWYIEYKKAEKKNLVCLSYYNAVSKEHVVSIVREIKNGKKDGECDILKIDVSSFALRSAILSRTEKYRLLLLNGDNAIIAASRRENGKAAPEETFFESDNRTVTRALAYLEKLTVAGVLTESARAGGINGETVAFVILILIIFVLSTSMIYAVATNMARQLARLTECTAKMEQGIFSPVPTDNVGTDEIGRLTYGMNGAIEKINSLFNEVFAEKMKRLRIEKEKRIAEFNSLQSQINPHFIFNLLEAVRMNAVRRADSETAGVMKRLSIIFRTLITWGNDMITMEKEMSFINAFLYLQEYNCPDVDMEIYIDDDAKKVKIPKMAIQVFAENAFVHGLDSVCGKKTFSLRATVKDKKMTVTVEDNGKGFPKEIADGINNKDISKIAEASHGIGIRNVMERLKLYFDDKYEIRTESIPFEKNLVEIVIPVTNDRKEVTANA